MIPGDPHTPLRNHSGTNNTSGRKIVLASPATLPRRIDCAALTATKLMNLGEIAHHVARSLGSGSLEAERPFAILTSESDATPSAEIDHMHTHTIRREPSGIRNNSGIYPESRPDIYGANSGRATTRISSGTYPCHQHTTVTELPCFDPKLRTPWPRLPGLAGAGKAGCLDGCGAFSRIRQRLGLRFRSAHHPQISWPCKLSQGRSRSSVTMCF